MYCIPRSAASCSGKEEGGCCRRRGEVSFASMNPLHDAGVSCSVDEVDPVEHERFLAQFANDRALTPDELATVAQKMVDATDPAEVERYREELMRGWYGGKRDA
jgi:hypothetical protein